MTNVCSPCMRNEHERCVGGVTVEGITFLPPAEKALMHVACDCVHEAVVRVR